MKNNYLIAFFLMFISLLSYSQEADPVFAVIDIPEPPCYPGDCTTLVAKYSGAKPTTDYKVSSIIYSPYFSFNDPSAPGYQPDASVTQIAIPTTGNQDDFWSANVFPLIFPFCFYGVNYDNLLVGSNGVLKFGTLAELNTIKGMTCPYNLNDLTIPNSNFPSSTNKVLNAIYGVMQDIDFGSGIGSINYKVLIHLLFL